MSPGPPLWVPRGVGTPFLTAFSLLPCPPSPSLRWSIQHPRHWRSSQHSRDRDQDPALASPSPTQVGPTGGVWAAGRGLGASEPSWLLSELSRAEQISHFLGLISFPHPLPPRGALDGALLDKAAGQLPGGERDPHHGLARGWERGGCAHTGAHIQRCLSPPRPPGKGGQAPREGAAGQSQGASPGAPAAGARLPGLHVQVGGLGPAGGGRADPPQPQLPARALP